MCVLSLCGVGFINQNDPPLATLRLISIWWSAKHNPHASQRASGDPVVDLDADGPWHLRPDRTAETPLGFPDCVHPPIRSATPPHGRPTDG